MSKFELFVALRYLRSKRKEVFISIISVISVLSVAISVMVLDMVMAIMTGFETELQAKLLDANAHIVLRNYKGYVRNWSEVSDAAKKSPGVLDAFPYTYSQVMLSSGNSSKGVVVRGINQDSAQSRKLAKLLKGEHDVSDLFNPSSVNVVRPDGSSDKVNLPGLVVGKSLARSMGLGVGSVINLLSPQLTSSPHGLIPKHKRFVVVGIYNSGLVEYENSLAYTSLRNAQRFFGFKDAVTGVEVVVDDLFKAREIADNLMEELGPLGRGFYATDWTQPNKALWEAFRLEKRVYFIVLLLLVLIASFTIVSTLVMVVMEKSRDIAVLKTLGASNKKILNIFLLQGSLIGVTGVLLGSLSGYLGCLALKHFGFPIDSTVFGLEKVPVNIVPLNFVVVALCGFVITSLAGLYPAKRATKIRPAEILRYE